jgi:hypothetical protein
VRCALTRVAERQAHEAADQPHAAADQPHDADQAAKAAGKAAAAAEGKHLTNAAEGKHPPPAAAAAAPTAVRKLQRLLLAPFASPHADTGLMMASATVGRYKLNQLDP